MTKPAPYRQRPLEPLDDCPPDMLAYYLGDCVECRRPTCSKKSMGRVGGLARWFLSRCTDLCSSCYARKREGPTTRAGRQSGLRRATDSQHRARTPAQIRALRLQVGACPECGWTRDMGAHVACPTIEQEAS